MELSLQERLKNISWLANCGKPIDYTGVLPIYRASSWKEAGELMHDPTWFDVLLSEQNKMSLYLGKNHFQRFQIEWNPTAVRGRTFYDDHLKAMVSNAISQNVQDAIVAKDATTTIHTLIVKIIMDQAFADCNMPFLFHREALKIFEAGHLPCGWISPWPNGKLAIY